MSGMLTSTVLYGCKERKLQINDRAIIKIE